MHATSETGADIRDAGATTAGVDEIDIAIGIEIAAHRGIGTNNGCTDSMIMLGQRCSGRFSSRLDGAAGAPQASRMSDEFPTRRRSASAPFVPEKLPASARDRILLALELGRRGQLLEKLGRDAKSKRDVRSR